MCAALWSGPDRVINKPAADETVTAPPAAARREVYQPSCKVFWNRPISAGKASRYRARVSRLSRGAATDRSHGRKTVVRVSFRREPRRGERVTGICRTYGAYRVL